MARNLREMTLVLDGRLGGGLRSATSEAAKRLDAVNGHIKQLNAAKVDVTKFRKLKTSVDQTEHSFAAAQAEVARLAREMKLADSPSKKLTSQFERAKSEAGRLKDKLHSDQIELERLRRSMSSAGISTHNLSGDTKELDARMSAAQKEAEGLRQKLSKLEHQERRNKNASEGMGRSLKAGLASIIKTGLVTAGAYIGIQELRNGYTEVITAANGQIRAETRLQTLMSNVRGTRQKDINAIKAYSAELQKSTVIGDEVTIAGASQLSTFQLQAANVKKMLPALQDLAVGQYGVNLSQEQIIQSANLMGKVFTGQVGALRRVGVSFNKAQEQVLKNGTEAEKTAMIIEVLKQNYGGLATQMAKTDEGRIIKMKNAIGDMKEKLGIGVLLPLQQKVLKFFVDRLPAMTSGLNKAINYLPQLGSKLGAGFREVFSVFTKAWPSIRSALGSLFAGVKSVFDAVSPVVKDIWAVVKPLLSFLLSSVLPVIMRVDGFTGRILKPIAPLLYGIAGAWVAYKLAVIATQAPLLAIQIAQKGLAAAQWLVNAAMNANPIGLIITGVGLLAGGIYLLIKHWKQVKAAMSAAWKWFLHFATEGPGRFIPIVNIVGQIAQNWDKVKAALLKVWDVIKKVWDIAKKFGGKVISAVVRTIGGKDSPIPKHASGGIFDSPHLGLVAESGPEAIIPLNNRQRSWDLLNTVNMRMGMATGGINISIPVTINGTASRSDAENLGSTIKRKVIEAINEISRDNRRRSVD